jgi:hypothetical protein
MCSDRIMWPPASKIRYRDDTCMILSQYRVYTSIIEANLYTLFICIFSRILDSPQSIDRVLSLFSSRPNWDPPPRRIACRRGGGESQFGRGDRHCGSLGIYVLCGTASLENLSNKFGKNPRNLRVCGRFLMCFPAIDRKRENTCEIFKMINTIAGEHMPESIQIKNVYSRYRLDSG